ncbi:kinesin-like protein KIN-12E isoform X2 [Andrographis paniculata]|nr:kinesin-like protein KIN-12E isoform X2 [Andrographis paniculata]
MSAVKSRFGYHRSQQSEAPESAMKPAKSCSSPDLLLKSAARDDVFLTSSHRTSKHDDEEATSNGCARSFEFREDPSFWKDHNVQVIIRIRPLSSSEISTQGNQRCVKQDSSQSVAWTGHPESRFTFDLVADETVSQEMLFRVTGVPMVENCVEGYNSCMFAYGQTGSGKTHTMLGDIEGGARRHNANCGMTPRVFEYLFSRIQKERDARSEEKLKFTCRCSFLEIYNEQIFDLLDPSSSNLQIREDSKKGVYVENLTEVEVMSARDVIQQLIQGAANRKVAATNMNRASSRSHSVFTCVIESKWESQGVTRHRFARLNLVDLAGSERQKSSGAEGERLKEATNINKSLSTLGLVIMNLVNISNGKSLHVPYRDSKLTFLLQDSLGGNAKTIIIANISPSSCCSVETLGTLKFAQRAKYIKNHAIINEDASGDVLALRLENQNLRKEVSRLRSLVNGGGENQDSDIMSLGFHGSPGTFKWDGLHGLSSPLASAKKTSRKKEYEVALVGAFRREKDKDIEIQALQAETQAAVQLAKQREDENQSLKLRLRFREAEIKRLEAVASGKISAEEHLLKEKEELLKEIEVLRNQVGRNQEATRFALENLRLNEEIRRLKSFCEEGERESILQQITILKNELLEALDWKLMHESEPANIQKEVPNTVMDLQSDDNLLNSDQFLGMESASPWRTRMNEENEFLRIQAIQNQSEIDLLRKKLDFCTEEKEHLERQINELANELNAERLAKQNHGLIDLPLVSSDQTEIKTMVDAIAAVSEREAEAHERVVSMSKETDELRSKLKVSIEEKNKLIDLYERAVAENKGKSDDVAADEQAEVESLKHHLSEMHEENDRLLSLYEKAMQERDELKRVIEVVKNDTTEAIADDVMELDELHEPDRREGDERSRNSFGTMPMNLAESLNQLREKLVEAKEKLMSSTKTFDTFRAIENAIVDVEALTEKIRKLEAGIREKRDNLAYLKSLSSERQAEKDLANNKLLALRQSLKSFSSSLCYFEQREAIARSKLAACSKNVSERRDELSRLRISKKEAMDALSKLHATETELRNNMEKLKVKSDEASRRVESDKVLFAIENVEKWQMSGKATELLRFEEDKTKLRSEMKVTMEKLGGARMEAEALGTKLSKIEKRVTIVENEIAAAEEMERKLETAIREKETVMEMREDGVREFGEMTVEYYERLLEAAASEEGAGAAAAEVAGEWRKVEELWREKEEGVRRMEEVRKMMMMEDGEKSGNIMIMSVEECIGYMQVCVEQIDNFVSEF